jgi:hypothetical protein
MSKVVFLNGPPGCGKDTMADSFSRQFYHIKMSAPLKVGCYNLFFGVNDYKLSPLELIGQMEIFKEAKVLPELDLTWRQFLIETSENLMKPLFGEDIFGRIVRDSIKLIQQRGDFTKRGFIISDSGFEEEALPIIYEEGAENCVLIRIHRNGCDFEGDSRSYIDLEKYHVKSYDVDNNGTVEKCVLDIDSVLYKEGIL